MTTQKKAPNRQIITILMVCGIFEQLTWLPELSLLTSTGDIVSTVLLAAVLQATLLLPLYFFLRKQHRLQGIVATVTAVLYGIYFLAAAAYILFCGYLFLSRTVMPQTPGMILLVLLLVSGCYIAARDTAAVVKTGAFFAAGSIIVIVLFFLLSLPQMDWSEVYLVPQEGTTVWRAAIHGALRSLSAPVLLVLLDEQPRESGRILFGSWLGIYLLFSLLGMVTVSVLGVVSEMVLFPVFMQITTVQIYDILQRMDVIWIGGWGMALLAVLGVFIHCGGQCLKHIAKKSWIALYLILAGGAMAIYWYAGKEQVQNALRQGWMVPLIQLFFCFLLPCLLLLLRKIQSKNTNTVQKGKK